MTDFAKDPSNTYVKAYFDKLNNQISIQSGKFIPVFNRVPDNAQAPYIILSSVDLTPHQNSSYYGFSASIVIDIVTRFSSGGGQKLANDIGNQIFQKVLTRDVFFQDEEWNIYTTKLSNSRFLESQNASDYVIRKLITFSNLIQQL